MYAFDSTQNTECIIYFAEIQNKNDLGQISFFI